MPLCVVTTILEPAPNFVSWLDYHLRRCSLIIIYLDDTTKRPLFEQLCSSCAVKLFNGSMDAPAMSRSNRLLLRQASNLEHAINYLLELGGTALHAQDSRFDEWWLLHID